MKYFDPQAFIKKLEEGGATTAQAEAHADILTDMFRRRISLIRNIDVEEYVRRLVAVGIAERQARAQGEAIFEAFQNYLEEDKRLNLWRI